MILVVLLFGGACSVDERSADSSSATTTAQTTIQNELETDENGDSQRGPVLADLDDYGLDLVLFDADLTGQFSSQESLLASEKFEQDRLGTIEERLATCMNAQGFDYFPVAPEELVIAIIDPDYEFASREWVEHYGLWVSTTVIQASSDLPEGIVGDGTNFFTPPGLEGDPNEQYRLSLDDAARAAYERELTEPNGCKDEISSSVPMETAAPLQFDLGEEESLNERVLSDPAYIEYERELMRCLAEQGADLLHPLDDAIEHYDALSETLLFEDPELVFESPEWFEVLRKLQAEERFFALTYFDCGGSPAAQRELFREILARLEIA